MGISYAQEIQLKNFFKHEWLKSSIKGSLGKRLNNFLRALGCRIVFLEENILIFQNKISYFIL